MEEQNKRKPSFWVGLLVGMAIMVVLCGVGLGVMYFKLTSSGMNAQVTSESDEELLSDRMLTKIDLIQKMLDYHCLYDVNLTDMQEGLLKGMVSGLGDPYTCYFDAEETHEFTESLSGVFSGIGLVMQEDMDTLLTSVIRVYPDSPAEAAGIQPGDIFYQVDGEDVTGMDSSLIASKVKGEEGTDVTIVFQRDGSKVEVTCTRAVITALSVDSRMLDDGIGYIELSEFSDVCDQQFAEALQNLESQGMKGLIVDLRNNTGGDVDATIHILDGFLPEQEVLRFVYRDGSEKTYSTTGNDTYDKPVVVLVNEWSASASEIFTGVMKDLGAATIVGTQTYGKGVVQSCLDLADSTMLKVTIAEYFTPGGETIHEVGITPDIVVEQPDDSEDDVQLQTAVDTILQKLSE